MIIGNDISEFQNQIDWNTYKNNSNFVIIRSTFGNGYYDKWFAFNRDHARECGLPHGFYHYAYPQYNAPEAEAEWFCKALYDIQEDEVVCLDFEEHYEGDVVDWCKKFLDYVQSKLGVKPFIYLNQSQTQGYNWQPIVDADYALWLASYQADGVGNTGNWPSMAMQQTTSSQSVPGIIGNVDRDVFFGDAEGFKKYGYHKPTIVETPVESQPSAPQTASTEPGPTTTTSTNSVETPQTSVETSSQTPSVPTQPASPNIPSNKPKENQFLAFLKALWIFLGKYLNY